MRREAKNRSRSTTYRCLWRRFAHFSNWRTPRLQAAIWCIVDVTARHRRSPLPSPYLQNDDLLGFSRDCAIPTLWHFHGHLTRLAGGERAYITAIGCQISSLQSIVSTNIPIRGKGSSRSGFFVFFFFSFSFSAVAQRKLLLAFNRTAQAADLKMSRQTFI